MNIFFAEVVTGSDDDNKQRKNRRENIVVEKGSDDVIDTYNSPFLSILPIPSNMTPMNHVTGEGIEPSVIWRADA